MTIFPETTAAHDIYCAIREPGLNALGPGEPRSGAWLRELEKSSDAELLGLSTVADPQAARAVRSGLLLLADRLDESHTISQSIPTSEGSFWHGIMHRREPDYSNAKYWFRKVGEHPLFSELASADRPGLDRVSRQGRWDPFLMVDRVEEAERAGSGRERDELRELQALEMDRLLAHCYRLASGR